MKPIVLLIDDDENVLSGLVRSLHKEPYQLLTAKSGDEAMLILKNREVDVIVIDEIMPGISGSDLLAWAAENAPDTIRIMLTGNATTSIAIRAINEGQVYNFFTKPCDDVQLAVAIRKAIEHRGLIDRESSSPGVEPAAILRAATVFQKTRPFSQSSRQGPASSAGKGDPFLFRLDRSICRLL